MSVSEPLFADCTLDHHVITAIPGERGESHRGDAASGPIVVWLAHTPPAEIAKAMERSGWPVQFDARALHDCARRWLAERHPGLLDDGGGPMRARAGPS